MVCHYYYMHGKAHPGKPCHGLYMPVWLTQALPVPALVAIMYGEGILPPLPPPLPHNI